MDKTPETNLNKITLAKKDVKINNLQTKIVVSLWKKSWRGRNYFTWTLKGIASNLQESDPCPVPFPPNQPNYNIKRKLWIFGTVSCTIILHWKRIQQNKICTNKFLRELQLLVERSSCLQVFICLSGLITKVRKVYFSHNNHLLHANYKGYDEYLCIEKYMYLKCVERIRYFHLSFVFFFHSTIRVFNSIVTGNCKQT